MPYFEDTSVTANVKEVADFRAWGKKISEGLAAVGLVKTSDTGQIDWATVEVPAINTMAGYEIWRFNDAEQSERPIYIKIEYGRGATEPIPAIKCSVGRGSNGSGTLTTASATREAKPSGTPAGNGLIYISFHKGALAMVSSVSPAQGGENATLGVHVLMVERLRSALDNSQLDAVAFNCDSGETPLRSFTVYSAGSWQTARIVSCGGSEVISNVLLPAVTYINFPVLTAPLHGLVGCRAGAIGSGDTGKFTIGGEEFTYKRVPISKGCNMMSGALGATSEGTNYIIIHET
jgi:hypothetical protein